jgi:hypothetical protein
MLVHCVVLSVTATAGFGVVVAGAAVVAALVAAAEEAPEVPQVLGHISDIIDW